MVRSGWACLRDTGYDTEEKVGDAAQRECRPSAPEPPECSLTQEWAELLSLPAQTAGQREQVCGDRGDSLSPRFRELAKAGSG